MSNQEEEQKAEDENQVSGVQDGKTEEQKAEDEEGEDLSVKASLIDVSKGTMGAAAAAKKPDSKHR